MLLTYLMVYLSTLQRHASAQIDLDKCKKEYLCLRHPTECTSLANCDAVATFEYVKKDETVVFQITSNRKWVGLAQKELKDQGHDRMVKLRGQYCIDTGSGVALANFNGNDLSQAGTPQWVQKIPEVTVLAANKDSKNNIYCKFKRPVQVKAPEKNLYSLDNKLLFAMAFGRTTSGNGSNARPSYHGYRSYMSDKCDVAAGYCGTVEDDFPLIIKVHGILMSIAWTLLATCGICMPMMMKPVLSRYKLIGKDAWFILHVTIMGLCVLTFIGGFIVILIHLEWKWTDNAGNHQWLGLFAIICGLIQPVMAFFRPNPNHNYRFVFNWTHRLVGILAWILSALFYIGTKSPSYFSGCAVIYGLKISGLENTTAIAYLPSIIGIFILVHLISYFTKPGGNRNGYTSLGNDDEQMTFLPWLFMILIFGCAIGVTAYHVYIIANV